MSDTTDDLEYGIDLWDDSVSASREEQWKQGKHQTKEGRTILIKDMEISHLERTIKYFDHLETTPLKKELKRRTLLSTSQE